MPKTRQQKIDAVNNLKTKLEKSVSVVFATQAGIAVQDVQKLRQELRQSDSEFLSIKKTLLRLALKDEETNRLYEKQGNGVCLVLSYGDEVSAAKAIYNFGKDHAGMKIVGGILEKNIIDASTVEALAQLPGKDELLSIVVRTIQAPISGVVNVMAGTIRSLVTVLSAYQESK